MCGWGRLYVDNEITLNRRKLLRQTKEKTEEGGRSVRACVCVCVCVFGRELW